MTDAGVPSVGRAGATVASGTVVSRLLGFVNAILLFNTIGTVGQGADAFSLANQIPNNVYAIIAGGTLTAVIVPAIIRAAGHDDGGARFLNRLVTLGLSLFAILAIAAVVAAPLLVHLYAQTGADDGGRGFGADQLALAYAFAYWCLPQIFFYAMFAILSEVLNAKGAFWGYAWAPVVNNVVFAAVLVGFLLAFGSADGLAAADWTTPMIVVLAGGATLGIAGQALVLVVAWRRARIPFRLDFRFRGVGLGRFGLLTLWPVGMVLVGQAVGILESNVASQATGFASIATLNLAWLIFMLPYSVVTLSILVPYFTRMSTHAREDDLGRVGADLTSATTAALMLLVFSVGGLAALSPALAALFTQDPAGREALTVVLLCYLVGMLPFSVNIIVQRVFFALQDTRTPFLLQTGQAVLFAIGLVLLFRAPKESIAALIALAMSGAMWLVSIASVAVAKRAVPALRVGRIVGRLGWYLLAAIPTAGAGFGIVWALGGGTAPGWLPNLLACAAAGAVMLVVYAGLLWVSRNPELRGALAPVIERLRSRRGDSE